MRACLPLLALLLAWYPCCAGRAERPVPLVWEAPASCPDEATARGMIERALGSDLISDVLSIHAQIVEEMGDYELALSLHTAGAIQRRRARARRCDTFVQLIALELRLTAAPTPTRSADRVAAPSVTRSFGMHAGATLGSAPVPAPAVGAALGVSFARKQLLLALDASYWAPRTQRSKSARTVTARIDGFGVNARACYVLAAGRLAFPLCGGAELGVLRARASGVDQARRAESLWAALFVSPGMRVQLGGPLWAYLDVGAFLGLRRPRFGVRNLPTLHRPQRFSVRGGLGLALQFD
jgi:hypothetical protein